MRKLLLVAGLVAAAALPSLASAQPKCEQPPVAQARGPLASDGPPGPGNGAVCARALGYFDRDGQWHASADARQGVAGGDAAGGYHDSRGGWIGEQTNAGEYGADAAYEGQGGRWDVDSREARLEQRIQSAADFGALGPDAAGRDLDRLNDIRRDEAGMREDSGQLSAQDEDRLDARLDRFGAELRQSLGGGQH
jgi:hypothetical protein